MAPDGDNQGIAQAVNEISERASTLIREEIELAKVEVQQKVTRIAKGAAIGAAAGIFAVVGLLFLLHAAAWAFYVNVFDTPWWGYFIVAVILFVLGGVAGWLAARFFKKGTPPTPQMAIEEAKLIRETVTGDAPAPLPAEVATTRSED